MTYQKPKIHQDEHHICIDFTDLDQIRAAMDEYGNIDRDLFSMDPETGEDQILAIHPDRIILTVFQANGWIRVMHYWYDGTIEETYNGRWE